MSVAYFQLYWSNQAIQTQGTIAQMEQRTDVLLSTLRNYVEAMGGRLELIVQFPDRAPVILQGFRDATEPQT